MDKKEAAREAKELAARAAIEAREERERTINAKQKAFKWSQAPSTYVPTPEPEACLSCGA